MTTGSLFLERLKRERDARALRIEEITTMPLDPTTQFPKGPANDPRILLPINPYKMRATLSANQTSLNANQTVYKVAFDTTTFDTAKGFSTANNNYTVKVAGYYVITANVNWIYDGTPTSGTDILNRSWIYVNGAAQTVGTANAYAWPTSGIVVADYGSLVTDVIYLNSGDVVDIRVEVYIGGGATTYHINSSSPATYWSMHLVSI